MVEQFNIQAVIRDRANQPSFHLVSGQHVRVEFRNLEASQEVGPFAYDGDVIVTCYKGSFQFEAGSDTRKLSDFDQAVVPAGEQIRIVCKTTGTIQMIWSPAHAATT